MLILISGSNYVELVTPVLILTLMSMLKNTEFITLFLLLLSAKSVSHPSFWSQLDDSLLILDIILNISINILDYLV